MAPSTGRAHHPTDAALADRLAELAAAALANAALLAAEMRHRHTCEQRETTALRESERGAALLRMLGHELDRPLSPLVSAAERLAASANGPERQLAELLRQQSQELHTVVAGVLEFSQLSAGILALERRVIDLHEVLAEALAAASDPPIHHTTTDTAEPLFVYADGGRLARAFASLVATVSAHAVRGGRIEVRTGALPNATVEVTIQGHATAPPAVPLDDVLEMFSSASGPSTPPGASCALGLAIARRVVELHGGRIWAVHPTNEAGVAFRVQLPRALLRG
jgi:K+-sensing histidine kinase KdpD